MEYKRLEDILDYIQPTNYIVESEKYDDSFKTPVLTAGKSFLLGYTDEINGIFNADLKNPIILFDDFTTDYKWVDFAFKVKSSACKILIPKTNVNLKYVFYAMKYVNIDTKLHKRYWISIFSKQLIPYPDNEIQTKIVIELDKIHNLIKNNEEELMKFDEIVKSQFIEMLNKEESENWPQYSIGELYKFQYGKGNNIPESKGDYPCYGSNGQVGYHTEWNNEDAPIIGHIGAYAGAVVWAEGKHFVTYNGVMCKLKNKYILNPKFGYILLCNQNYLEGARNGAAQPFVSYDTLEKPITKLPPIDLQNKFADFVQQTDKSKFIVQKQIRLLEELLEKKMNEYFGQ